jgi:hypothetical protein
LEGEALANLRILFLLDILLERLDITVRRDRHPDTATTRLGSRLDQRLHLHDTLIRVAAGDPLTKFVQLQQHFMPASRAILGNTPALEPVNEHLRRNPTLHRAHDRSSDSLGSVEVFWQDGSCGLIEHIIVEIGIVRDVTPLHSTQFTRHAVELRTQSSDV